MNIEDTGQIAKIPVNPETHRRFMNLAKYYEMEVTIKEGYYHVQFDDPSDLYYFGANMTIPDMGEDFKCGYGLPVTHERPPQKQKKK